MLLRPTQTRQRVLAALYSMKKPYELHAVWKIYVIREAAGTN